MYLYLFATLFNFVWALMLHQMGSWFFIVNLACGVWLSLRLWKMYSFIRLLHVGTRLTCEFDSGTVATVYVVRVSHFKAWVSLDPKLYKGVSFDGEFLSKRAKIQGIEA